VKEQTHLDITRQQITKHDNKINNNCVNESGNLSNSTTVIIQSPVHGEDVNGTEMENNFQARPTSTKYKVYRNGAFRSITYGPKLKCILQ